MLSPTRKRVRLIDKWGSGKFGARRGDKEHDGTDFECSPNQPVLAPITGTIEREAPPYATGPYSGLVIKNNHVEIKLFYVDLNKDLIGKCVEKGKTIGIAQDISKKYPGMIPHVHLRIVKIDPELLLDMP